MGVVRRQPQGRRTVGFQLEVPGEVNEVEDGPALMCRELRQDGRLVGELEVSVFSAALIIDRDGLLAERACTALAQEAAVPGGPVAVAVALPGASGFRASAVRRTDVPYVYVFALAPTDFGMDGGIMVTVRSVGPDWAAGDHMLRTLRIVTPGGRLASNHEVSDEPIFPVVKPTRD